MTTLSKADVELLIEMGTLDSLREVATEAYAEGDEEVEGLAVGLINKLVLGAKAEVY
jgi:hypothetical protein